MKLAKKVLFFSGALAGVSLLVAGGTCAISVVHMGRQIGEAGDLRQAAEALRAYRESEGHFPAVMPPGPNYLRHWTSTSRHGYPRTYVTDGQRFVLASPGHNGKFERPELLELPPLVGEEKAEQSDFPESDMVITHLGWRLVGRR